MAMILSALLRRGAGPRHDTGEAPLRTNERYWRPKPLTGIVDVPLAPADDGDTGWWGRPGERKPL